MKPPRNVLCEIIKSNIGISLAWAGAVWCRGRASHCLSRQQMLVTNHQNNSKLEKLISPSPSISRVASQPSPIPLLSPLSYLNHSWKMLASVEVEARWSRRCHLSKQFTACTLELQTNHREVCSCIITKSSSSLSAATTAFTFKNLLKLMLKGCLS